MSWGLRYYGSVPARDLSADVVLNIVVILFSSIVPLTDSAFYYENVIISSRRTLHCITISAGTYEVCENKKQIMQMKPAAPSDRESTEIIVQKCLLRTDADQRYTIPPHAAAVRPTESTAAFPVPVRHYVIVRSVR